MCRTGSMSYENHLTKLKDFYSKYLEAANISTYDELVDAVIKEQLMNSLHPNVQVFVFSKQPKTSSDCAKSVDLSFQVKQLHNQNFNYPNQGFIWGWKKWVMLPLMCVKKG